MVERKQSDTVQLKVRMKEPLRAELEKSAAEKGISINSEVVERLDHSFTKARLVDSTLERVYGRENAAIFEILAKIIVGVSAISTAVPEKGDEAGFSSARWLESPTGFGQTIKAINYFLDALRPEGEVRPSLLDELLSSQGGRAGGFADALVEGMLRAISNSAKGQGNSELRERLGKVAERIDAWVLARSEDTK